MRDDVYNAENLLPYMKMQMHNIQDSTIAVII